MRFAPVIFLALLLPGLQSVVRAKETMLQVPRRLTNIISSYPTPSPDGKLVLFQSNRTGRWEIYVMNIDGSDQARLTDFMGDNVTPVWSPDGKLIAFAASLEGNSDIYVMNSDGDEVKGLRTTQEMTRIRTGHLMAAGSSSTPHEQLLTLRRTGWTSGMRSSA